MVKEKNILVIGAGSIGERHIRNLWQQGFHNIIVYRQRNIPFRDITDAKVTIVTEWNTLLQLDIFVAIICTPTSQHLSQTYSCIENGWHVLVEKPLSHQLFNVEPFLSLIKEKNTLLQVGYMLRYHPLLQLAKEIIENETYGKLINIQTYWGEYLPDWHPWEDYRNSYAAKVELGGGPALTLSHDIDIANWLSGANIKLVQPLKNYASLLEVETESLFDLNIAYENNTTAHIHVNFCQRKAQRWYKIITSDAVIDIDYYANSLTISDGTHTKKETVEGFDRNNLFIAQQNDFFDRISVNEHYLFSKQQLINAYNITKICTHE
ncbi:MAG: Gfo/Idh/MocA family oxidoreductase [Bacteroidetes bacterium]|nr:Gfo/Idh/MocA family oxidoreductase [Bacteroidota bacterium]